MPMVQYTSSCNISATACSVNRSACDTNVESHEWMPIRPYNDRKEGSLGADAPCCDYMLVALRLHGC